jgi:hypothetical protein
LGKKERTHGLVGCRLILKRWVIYYANWFLHFHFYHKRDRLKTESTKFLLLLVFLLSLGASIYFWKSLPFMILEWSLETEVTCEVQADICTDFWSLRASCVYAFGNLHASALHACVLKVHIMLVFFWFSVNCEFMYLVQCWFFCVLPLLLVIYITAVIMSSIYNNFV